MIFSIFDFVFAFILFFRVSQNPRKRLAADWEKPKLPELKQKEVKAKAMAEQPKKLRKKKGQHPKKNDGSHDLLPGDLFFFFFFFPFWLRRKLGKNHCVKIGSFFSLFFFPKGWENCSMFCEIQE